MTELVGGGGEAVEEEENRFRGFTSMAIEDFESRWGGDIGIMSDGDGHT